MTSAYVPGDWNAVCAICGMQSKASALRKTWRGTYVCEYDWEPRHPQDFVRPVPDNQAPPWAQLQFLHLVAPHCNPNRVSALPGYAVPGCMIPGYVSPLVDPNLYD